MIDPTLFTIFQWMSEEEASPNSAVPIGITLPEEDADHRPEWNVSLRKSGSCRLAGEERTGVVLFPTA